MRQSNHCHGMWIGSTRRMDTSCHRRECQGIREISMRHSGILLIKYKHSMVGKTQYPLPSYCFSPVSSPSQSHPPPHSMDCFIPEEGLHLSLSHSIFVGFFFIYFLLLESNFYCSFCSSNTQYIVGRNEHTSWE